MSSPYASGSTGSRSSYASGSSGYSSPYAKGKKATFKRPEHHGGVGGFFTNLGHDAVGAVAGLGPGIVHTGEAAAHDVVDIVKHPTSKHHFKNLNAQAFQPTLKSYKQTYGPLRHGDVSTFLHTVYSHPLGPILDATTLLTGGSGAAAKAGILSSEAKVLKLASPGGLVDAEKLTSHNPAIRMRQTLTHNLLNKLPYEAPHVGEAARWARQARKGPQVAQLSLLRSRELVAYNKAVRPLNNVQLVALHLIGNDLHPADYAATLRRLQEQGGHVEPAMFKVLDNPQVLHEFENPSPKVQRAVAAAQGLSGLSERVLGEHGQLAATTAESNIGRHRVAAQDILGSDHELKPTPGSPFFVPDVPLAKRVANSGGSRQGGGWGVPRNVVRQNHGVLFQTGQLALGHDILGPKFLESVKHAHADDLHNTLMKGAARISEAEAKAGLVPKGWEFVPKEVISKVSGLPRSQKIHPLIRSKGEAVAQMKETGGQSLSDRFTVKNLQDAARLHGDYLIAPTSLKKELVGEFTRSTGAARKFIGAPFKVWRALVLGLRPAFLVNNVVGNNLLYAIDAAGHAGLRSYLNAVKREHGAGTVKSLLNMKGVPPAMRDQFMREFFPEQVEGTFGSTQRTGRLATLDRTKIGRASQTLATGVAPATQAVAEGTVRRALTESMIRRSPEFKKMYRGMPRQTREFEAAAKKVIKGKNGEAYRNKISSDVNDALGDYLNMSEFEQKYIRSVLPFYAWYRAIARISTRLLVNHPGRADILAKLGQIGEQNVDDKFGKDHVPSLDTFVGVGGVHNGHRGGFSTNALNPFNTDTQLGQGAKGLLAGKPGDLGHAFASLGPNPFVLALAQSLAGKNLYTGRDLGGSSGLPAQLVEQVFGQVPQMTLLHALQGDGRTSKTFGQQTALEALLQYLGATTHQAPVAP